MLRAFEAFGYKVHLVDGYSAERRAKFRQLARSLESGVHYDFCYAKNAPSPYALTDPDHIPRSPLLDRNFFRTMRAHGIPIGVFYRDIFWRFPVFKREHSLAIRLLSLPFFRHDLQTLKRGCVDALFLPSSSMAQHFPRGFVPPPIVPLPPGASTDLNSETTHTFRKKAVYIGGLLPPVYQLQPMFECMRKAPEWTLTVICREDERRQTDQLYPWTSCPNVSIVHASGEEAQAILAEADVFLWLHEPEPYLDFARPVKIFEAMVKLSIKSVRWLRPFGEGCFVIMRRTKSLGFLLECKRLVFR